MPHARWVWQAGAQHSLGLDPGLIDTMKLAGVVLTAAGLAIFLLWLLFSGGSQQEVCWACLSLMFQF